MPVTPGDPETPRSGKPLEREVARIYVLLGGTAECRLLIDGYEIDIHVIMKKGPVRFPFVVECKEYKPKRAVSGKEMATFVVKVEAARKIGKAYTGVFVTTSHFSPQARATADKYGIQCLTLTELRNQLVDFEPYLLRVISTFNATNLSKWYVEQTLSELEDYDALDPEETHQFLHPAALDYLESLFNVDERIAILGNVGTGKSALCQALLARFARRALSSPSARIPILVDLRNFRSGLDIQQAIVYAMSLQGVEIERKVCEELQRLGRFFFILDGLDEMASKVDRSAINENLRAIDQLRTAGNNKYLLTCRTHFFQERVSDEFLTEYNVLYLTEWNWIQLDAYFRKRFGEQEGPARCERILRNPHIAALAKSPLLVDILLATDCGETDLQNVFGLLKNYTDDWITKQSRRRGAVMSPTKRRQFALTLAYHMYMENLSTLHFSNLYAVAKDFSGHSTASDIDYFYTDVCTCTFITRDSRGYYSFRPQTFFEFFAAEAIADRIESAEPGPLAAREITPEIATLIAARQVDAAGLTHLHAWSASFETAQLSQNAVRLLNALGVELSENVRAHYGVADSDRMAFRQSFGGDIGAEIEELVREHSRALLHYAKNRWFRGRPEDAEDVVQETWARFLRATGKDPARVRRYLNIRAFLFSLVRNVALESRRSLLHREVASTEDPELEERIKNMADGRPDPSEQYDLAHMASRVKRVLEKLPNKEQAVVRLWMAGLSVVEIAKRLCISEHTVQRQFGSGRQRLLHFIGH